MLNFSFVRAGNPNSPDIQVAIDIGMAEENLAKWMAGIIIDATDALNLPSGIQRSTVYRAFDALSNSQLANLAESAIKQLIGG